MTQLTQHSIDSGSGLTTPTPVNNFAGTDKGNGWSSNLSYLLIGGGIGAAVALLFAPKAGSEFRNDLSDYAQRGYGGALDLSHKVIDQSRDLYGDLKQKADDLTGGAATKLENKLKGASSNAVDMAADSLPNGGGEILEGLTDTSAGDRDLGSAKGSNTGF